VASVAALTIPPSADEAAKQTAPSLPDEVPPTESQAITATQADESDATEQTLAAQAPAATPGVTATPSPAPTVLTFAAPAEEVPQEKAGGDAESAEAGQMAAESAATPTEAPVPQENAAASAEVQTDQLTAESASAAPTEAPAPESLELEQSAPSPTPTATLTPQPSATPVALLTLPAPATPLATVPPASPTPNVPANFWLVAGLVVLGLLVVAGLILWLVNRSRP
jgi:hypothetical protein